MILNDLAADPSYAPCEVPFRLIVSALGFFKAEGTVGYAGKLIVFPLMLYDVDPTLTVLA